MEYRSSLEDQTFPRLLHRGDDRSIGQFESRLQGRKLGGGGNWPLRCLAAAPKEEGRVQRRALLALLLGWVSVLVGWRDLGSN